MNKAIRIYEVGPRDGIQVMQHIVDTDLKVKLIESLVKANLKDIEVGSFVHPKLVPNMADSAEVYEKISHLDGNFGVLVPNGKGLSRAQESGAKMFNVFFSPVASFNIANHGKTYDEVFEQYYIALKDIPRDRVRVYLSMSFHATKKQMHKAMKDALMLGDKVVLCDTDGKATSEQFYHTIRRALEHTDNVAIHLHQSTKLMQNVATAYDMGITEFDCSIGGMGGCPFVEGSKANLATEDLVQWCKERNIPCDVGDLSQALEIVSKIKQPFAQEPSVGMQGQLN